MRERFLAQTREMLKVLQNVVPESCFALKGGTAINFFIRDMPRLSVDIDLTYLPITPRHEALREISAALSRIKERVQKSMPRTEVKEKRIGGAISKLVVVSEGERIKVEPNLVLRGCVYGFSKQKLVAQAEKQFSLGVEMNVLSLPDIYGGKLCAALDRQHPRDLYDVMLLFENEGLTPEVRKAFIVYWVSHGRPLHEMIGPKTKDIRELYSTQFADMVDPPTSCEALERAREQLVSELQKGLSREEREFVLSIKQCEPRWDLLGIKGIEKLPGVLWKLQNIKKMPKDKHAVQLEKLRKVLEL